MKEIELTLAGKNPMLLHNSEKLLNPFDPTNREKKRITDKRTKQTDEDRLMVAKLEWTMSWYWDGILGPFLPSQNILMSMHTAAKKTRHGTQFLEAMVDMTEDNKAVLDIGVPVRDRTLDYLWGTGLGDDNHERSPFVDYRPAGQQRVKIMRCRPKLHEWTCTSRWSLDDTIIDVDQFKMFAEKAGDYCGLGDYRQQYGRFTVTDLQVKDVA